MPTLTRPRTLGRERLDAVRFPGFAARLRHYRLRQTWSQAELAHLTQGVCSRRTIQNWENGVTEPELGQRLRVVAAMLGVSAWFLLTGEHEHADD
jgi:transcriptional regulator with XRE-family HTH domain